MEELGITDINDVPLLKPVVVNYMIYEYQTDVDLSDESIFNELKYLYDNGLMNLLLDYEYTFSAKRWGKK